MPRKAPSPDSQTQATALIKWYLRSLDLGTTVEELSIVDQPFKLPQKIVMSKIHQALFLMTEYCTYARKARDENSLYESAAGPSQAQLNAIGNVNSSLDSHPAPLDLVPICVIFNLMLGFATEMRTISVRRSSELPASINWEKHGFPGRCACHGQENDPLQPKCPPVYARNVVQCSPEVCAQVMNDLYGILRSAIENHLSTITQSSFLLFGNWFDHRVSLARICTRYLATLDFGRRSRFMDRPWDNVQVIIHHEAKEGYSNYPDEVYYGALYLLKSFRDSDRYLKHEGVLSDVPLDWMFYTAVHLAAGVLYDEVSPSRVALRNFGFPRAKELQTKRWVCDIHAYILAHREMEDRVASANSETLRHIKGADMRKPWVNLRILLEENKKTQVEKNGESIERLPGPMSDARIGPLQYMRCRGPHPCVDGMTRLKDYMVGEVLNYDVNIYSDPQGFSEFMEKVKRKFK